MVILPVENPFSPQRAAVLVSLVAKPEEAYASAIASVREVGQPVISMMFYDFEKWGLVHKERVGKSIFFRLDWGKLMEFAFNFFAEKQGLADKEKQAARKAWLELTPFYRYEITKVASANKHRQLVSFDEIFVAPIELAACTLGRQDFRKFAERVKQFSEEERALLKNAEKPLEQLQPFVKLKPASLQAVDLILGSFGGNLEKALKAVGK